MRWQSSPKSIGRLTWRQRRCQVRPLTKAMSTVVAFDREPSRKSRLRRCSLRGPMQIQPAKKNRLVQPESLLHMQRKRPLKRAAASAGGIGTNGGMALPAHRNWECRRGSSVLKQRKHDAARHAHNRTQDQQSSNIELMPERARLRRFRSDAPREWPSRLARLSDIRLVSHATILAYGDPLKNAGGVRGGGGR